MQTRFTNRLINETSPYLLQHAHNPVNWFAWGEEALLKAKNENKVILVSIGYSACHWCHVMERESFENEEVAKLMNGHFVNIKIDREERPDLDHIYMDAVQAMSGSGGWPLNVFLTPGGKPFFGGTYFPPVKAFNRASWTEVLHGIAQAWVERESEIETQAENLTEHLKKASDFAELNSSFSINRNNGLFTIEQCHLMFAAVMKQADIKWGGFGTAPKFPQTFTIRYLLQYHYFTGNGDALAQALLSIDKMLDGGIYDHIAGGFARYSTDNEWLAPHFEKMLYDNALLVNILCDAYQLTKNKKYEDAIRQTILFVTNELLSGEGGIFAALDADSEGEEGKYYVWEKQEVDELLGQDSALFCAFYDITEQGNWEAKNIPRVLKPIEDFVAERNLDKVEFSLMLQKGLQKLSSQRSKRVKPALDDKIILGWNALMLNAVAKAALVLQDDGYRALAESIFSFLQKSFKEGNSTSGLLHTYKNGIAKYSAFLDDYAYLVAACIQLYKTTFNNVYLNAAFKYCNHVIENFSDDENIFFYFTHIGQKDIIVRKKEIYDGATPSGNSVMAENLYQLAVIYNKNEWRSRADQMVTMLSTSVIKFPGTFGNWATFMLHHVAGYNEIAVIGINFKNVGNNIMLNFIPNLIILGAVTSNTEFALLSNKPDNEKTLIYFCRNYTCFNPFSDIQSLMQEIIKTNKISR